MPLDLHANDWVLHYRHGQQTGVARANGVSIFSVVPDAQRPIVGHPEGRCSSRTSPEATEAETVYVEMFLSSLPPDARDLHVLVAQPVGAYFRSRGWSPTVTGAAVAVTAPASAAVGGRDCRPSR